MHPAITYRAIACLLLVCAAPLSAASWVYQGNLSDGGKPANGRYDLRLSLRDATDTNILGEPITFPDVDVKDGRFAVDVDFGLDVSRHPELRLQTEVQQGDSGFISIGASVALDADVLAAGTCWDTAGNAAATGDFVGTINRTTLELRAGGLAVGRFIPSLAGDQPNIVLGSASNAVTHSAVGTALAGDQNTVTSSFSIVAGGQGNTAGNGTLSGRYATVSGGFDNIASEFYSTVAGGGGNHAGDTDSAVGGGRNNTADGDASVIAGGDTNVANGTQSAVSGGFGNVASGGNSVVAGGFRNTTSGSSGFVGGGELNLASGLGSVVAGGRLNKATGDYSVAGGYRANALGDGSFSFADANNFDFSSSTPNAFRVRATGGVRFVVSIDGAGAAVNNCLLNGPGGWACTSDRNAKRNFRAADGAAILEKLTAMPIYHWQPNTSDTPHLGPMAQDFHARFALGDDDITINTIDLDGVALAAIQGLNRKLEDENARLRERDAHMTQVADALAARLAAVERLVRRTSD